MKNYKKLKIWQMGIRIVKITYDLTKQLPAEEKFNLESQMNRAAVSIPSNIAEGSSRSSDKDYSRFLQIALGSAFELDTQCELIKELQFGLEKEAIKLQETLEEECRMLQGFINKLNTT